MRHFTRLAVMSALVFAAAALVYQADAQAQGIDETSKTMFVLENVEIDRKLRFFAYCFAPENAQPVVTLHKLGQLKLSEQIQTKPVRTTQDLWSVWDFGVPTKDWPNQVDVSCRVQSRSIADKTSGRVILFTLVAEQPIPKDDLNRNTNIRFDPEPVTDSKIQSGQFHYDIPWAADVSIQIFKVTDHGNEDTKIVIQEQKSSAGLHATEWGKPDKFDVMSDGKYWGKIVAKKTGSGSSSGERKTMRADVSFQRKK